MHELNLWGGDQIARNGKGADLIKFAPDGKVTAFIPEPSVEAGAAEGIGVDDAGDVYAGWTAKMAVRRYVKQ